MTARQRVLMIVQLARGWSGRMQQQKLDGHMYMATRLVLLYACRSTNGRCVGFCFIVPFHIAPQIAKSPLSANVAVEYVITSGGVQQAQGVDGRAAATLVTPHSALSRPIANAPPG